MKASKHSVQWLVCLFAILCAMTLCLAPAAQMQKDSANASVQTKGGLKVVTFDTLNGKVIVNLPDDMMLGDTISGTVVAEPKGNNDAERARNESVLEGYVIELNPLQKSGQSGKVRMPVSQRLPLLISLGKGEGDQASRNCLEVMLFPPPPDARGSSSAPRDTAAPFGTVIIAAPPPPIAHPIGTVAISTAGYNNFKLPTLGQQGRPIEISGPFDGDSANTTVKIGGQDAPVLAESPRKTVFRAPTNVSGPMEITLKEGNKETKGTFRNVGVKLTAPKTTIYKGEIVGLEAQFFGFRGLLDNVVFQDVIFQLVKEGVVSMQGGDVQTISIKPADVQADGTFTTRRQITGLQTGVWSVTATVVVFNVCLQDDNNGSTLMFSSETGDYRFCGFAPGVNIAIAAPNDRGGGISSSGLPGGILQKDGTFTSADFNYAGGHVHWQVDAYTHTGTATVQTTKPKQTFTITDRDTRNNTCACKQ